MASSFSSSSSNDIHINGIHSNRRKIIYTSPYMRLSYPIKPEINTGVPKDKKTSSERKVTVAATEKPKKRLPAGEHCGKEKDRKAYVKDWLENATNSKCQTNIQTSGGRCKDSSKCGKVDTSPSISCSISDTSTNYYTNELQIATDARLMECFSRMSSSEDAETHSEDSTLPFLKIMSQSVLDASPIDSPRRVSPTHEEKSKTATETYNQSEEGRVSPPKKEPKYKPFLPIRSDQKKLSSKLFLYSLLPPSEKELNDLRRWKLKKSKQC